MTAIDIFTENVLSQDMVGYLSVDPEVGMVYYRTECCGASATGSGDGVACRACYRPVSDELGRAWMVADEASWAAYAERLRPELEEFADKVVARVRSRALSLSA